MTNTQKLDNKLKQINSGWVFIRVTRRRAGLSTSAYEKYRKNVCELRRVDETLVAAGM